MMMWASRTHARRPVRLSALAFLSLLCAGALVGTAAGAHGEGHWDADAVADTTAPLVVSIDFDPPNGVRRADPAMYTSFDAYVVLDGANPGNLPGGLRTLTLRLGVTDGTSSAPQFESLLPGKLVMGGWREGIMMASAPCSAEEHIVIGVMHLFYLGKPGVVSVLDHPDFPRWIVDCEDEAGRFEIGSHGGIHREPPPVDGGGNSGEPGDANGDEHPGGSPDPDDSETTAEGHGDI